MCIYLYIVDIYIKISLSDQFLYGMQHWAKIGEVHFKRFLILLRISIMNATHMGQCVAKNCKNWAVEGLENSMSLFQSFWKYMNTW